ncbi:(d)CMP kinase [Uliginosibacterium aquaticum]|uniref:Cytidylate kinase n=1 Tax=Uliginosibacterium aquaticum TaxID=2731212 RepID=A0ABX2IDM1_9RHOO|nr:(d)CMP kinase [Uliginosibacterium aquaticum]NSL54659.1 (d)CMP kinase [Uliginosibacterium aquaticum]
MVPVLAIDGPTASGKGTVAGLVAERLGWHFLDSGAIYRVLALAAIKRGVGLTDEAALAAQASALDVAFERGAILLEGEDVSLQARREETGNSASKIAALPAVRTALLERQQAFRVAPGLVADGRDMGSVVFPGAFLKIFLTASVESRAERRYKQLIAKGSTASIDDLLRDLRERDARDTSRLVAPLRPCEDAVLLDTTTLSIDEAVHFVLNLAMQRGAGQAA